MDDFNERIQGLTERHEALAQSVELFQHEIRELGQKLQLQRENIDSQRENIDKLTVESAAQQATVTQVLTAMKDLVEVATSHERRLGRLESA